MVDAGQVGDGSCDSYLVGTCGAKCIQREVFYLTLTLYPLHLGAPERHGQVKRDEVFVVAH